MFDPGPILLWRLIIDHNTFSMVALLPLIQEGLLSVTSESLCTEYWLTT